MKKKMADGGEVEAIRKKEREYEDPVPGPSERLEIYKGKDDRKHVGEVMTAAEGGMAPDVDRNEPGLQDASVADFLLPLIGAPSFAKAAGEVPAALEGLGEAGEISLGKAAPKMEEDILGATMKDPGTSDVTAYLKGVQKGMPEKGIADVKIYGVKGPVERLKALFGDEAPGSVPEHILKAKGIALPETGMAEGGIVDNLKKLFGSDKSDAQKADSISEDVQTSSGTAKHYADGGEVDSSQLPEPELDWKDKLAKVLEAMTSSPAGKIAGAAMDPLGTGMRAAVSAAPEILKTELPMVQKVASPMSGGLIPPPAAVAPQPAPQAAPAPMPVQPPPAAAPVSTPAAAPTEQKTPAMDILHKLTDGDGQKMRALLASLKDQDKRSAFAQALGIIGDTFGNIGQAKAGQHPDGFTTPEMLSKMNRESKESQIKNLTGTLESDPNSQTSRMAQSTLLQAMGIKSGDPREAAIRRLPAQAIVSMMPQMNEALKTAQGREHNLIEAGRVDTENKNKQTELEIQRQNADKALQASQTSAAADLLKNTSSLRDLVPGEGVRDTARATLERNLGTAKKLPPHEQDVQAVHWAHTHPQDPRSKSILAANGL